MDTNLTFEYGIDEIKEGIDGEISRHAAFLRFQDGSSAYDSLLVHTNERPTINGFVSDAFRAVLARFEGDGKYEFEDGDYYRLSFYLPDFDSDMYKAANEEIKRYVLLSVSANWLVHRSFGEYAKVVAVDAGESLNRIIVFLRSRKRID